MRIVHILPLFDPRKRYHEYYLAKYQAAAGHDVTIVTTKHDSFQRSQEKICNFTVVRVHPFLRYSDFVLARGMRRVLGDIKPDIVHSHDTVQGFQVVPAYYKNSLGFSYIIDQHKYSLDLRPSPFVRNEYRLFRRWFSYPAYKKADHIVAVWPSAEPFVRRYHPEYTGGISMIPLGFDSDAYYVDNSARERLRKKYGLEEGEIVLLSTGVMQRFKRIEVLIRAFNKVSKKSTYKLFFAGRGVGDYYQELQELAKNNPDIQFLGYQDENGMRELYNMADVCLWQRPTVSIAPAMACGCVPLLPDKKTTNFLIQGYGGIVFKQDDSESLYKAITALNAGVIRSEQKKILEHIGNISFAQLHLQYTNLYERLHSY